jgi:hypothetical protein
VTLVAAASAGKQKGAHFDAPLFLPDGTQKIRALAFRACDNAGDGN